MSVTSLLPIGGAALGLLASKAFASLSDSLSFKSLLAGNQATDSDKQGTVATQGPAALNLAEVLPQFVTKLRDRFQAAGVDLSQSLTLKADGHGAVIVDGDHPDRSTIEQVLAQDPQLLSDFQAIASAAAERRQNFPFGMDNSTFGEFRLSLANGTASVRFE